jgi:CRP/FNR family transcriptional regulator/CRP/FNR family cyclic AMP-dependent transcriptional regulator
MSLHETTNGENGDHRKEQYVGALPLLARLPDDDRRALARQARMRHYGPGNVIFAEGSAGDALHVVYDGRVNIVAGAGGGEEVTVAVIGPGDCFGEQALLDGLSRSASAVAAVATRTFVVTREAFHEWLAVRPTAALGIMETLSLRLRQMNQTVVEMIALDLEQRLGRQLVSLARKLDLETVLNNGTLRLQITQGQLASMLGVTRESVNKQLHAYAARGWVETSRGAITIIDMASLRRFE